MGWIQDFKEFAVKGNALELAVGLIIGAGFGKIVSSLVDDIIMPPIGQLTGGVDFKDLAWQLGAGPEAATLKYGHFLQTVVDFAIVAVVVFLLVKGVNRLRRRHEEPPAAPAAPSEEIVLLREIRDALRSSSN